MKSDLPMAAANRRVRVQVRGIVQGVGFRPFIFQLAREYGLQGWVRNQSDGVALEVAGTAAGIENFLRDIPAKAPPLARIVEVVPRECEFRPLEPFRIVESHGQQSRATLIAPDVRTCDACLRELFDPQNHRYRYPFINCTNCGPRYTIIKSIPYDRSQTTMAGFIMCPACRREYEDPGDRRFHAQPNACWECGPQVWLETADGRKVAEKDAAVTTVVRLLEQGKIVAIKGLGGFHLAVDASREAAVDRLRSRKVREQKPFAVMFADVATVQRCCRVSGEELALLQSPQRPIVLLERRSNGSDLRLAAGVAPRNRFVGALLPYTPLHELLFQASAYAALVMTSGNQSDEPIAVENLEARKRLAAIADFFLLHDRDIYLRCDDSVARVVQQQPRLIRRARGYVPVPVFLKDPGPAMLGVGAEWKNAICLTRDREAFLSQHIGDLENLETLRSFELTIAHLQNILEIEPACIVHDLHPDYLSTQWAMQQKQLPRFAVQHHHAHIAAVVAERQITGPVLGLALDGTGYGGDGTIWGGEILLVEGLHCKRLGHLRQVPLPGGGKAVREPWRMAVSYLWSLAPQQTAEAYPDLLERYPRHQLQVLLQMLERSINSPLTSSCGRLFDAVSALLGIRQAVTYEGQAAIELEQALIYDEAAYAGVVGKADGVWILDPLPLVAEVVADVRRGCAVGNISARFHNGLVAMLMQALQLVGREQGLRRIVLSGGVFQNAYLFENLMIKLAEENFEVYTHLEVPTNDAGIALGQAYLGREWLKASR